MQEKQGKEERTSQEAEKQRECFLFLHHHPHRLQSRKEGLQVLHTLLSNVTSTFIRESVMQQLPIALEAVKSSALAVATNTTTQVRRYYNKTSSTTTTNNIYLCNYALSRHLLPLSGIILNLSICWIKTD